MTEENCPQCNRAVQPMTASDYLFLLMGFYGLLITAVTIGSICM